MLVDTSKETTDEKGFNPYTDNTLKKPTPSMGEKIGWIVM